MGLDGDLVLDGFIRMIGMVQVHRVLGGDDPVGRGDARIRRAHGQTPGAHRPGEDGEAAAGQAPGQFLRIGKDFGFKLLPGLQNQAIDIVHAPPCEESERNIWDLLGNVNIQKSELRNQNSQGRRQKG